MAKLTKKQKEAYAKVDSSKSYDLAAASALVKAYHTIGKLLKISLPDMKKQKKKKH